MKKQQSKHDQSKDISQEKTMESKLSRNIYIASALLLFILISMIEFDGKALLSARNFNFTGRALVVEDGVSNSDSQKVSYMFLVDIVAIFFFIYMI